MVEFGGWEMPLNYPLGILAEHLATRKFGGLFDISHMGRFIIRGEDALPFIQYVLTNNAAALEPGQSQYTIVPNKNGGAVDDAYLYRMNEKEYLLVVNAANIDKDWAWFERYKQDFPRLILEDHTARIAMLALQGPRTKVVLQAVLGDIQRLLEPARNRLVTHEIFGANVLIARTGYTGEPIGFELFPPADIAVSLWRKLLEAGKKKGIAPIGLGARDTLRLEAGLPLYGHELGSDIVGEDIPVFALPVARFAVSFNGLKGEFVGREILMKQFQEIKLREEDQLDIPEKKLLVPRVIMPVSMPGDSIARPGCQVYIGEKRVGTVTSGTVIPYWKMRGIGLKSKLSGESGRRAICLAYLDADLKEGQRTKVIIRDKAASGMIVDRHMVGGVAPYSRPLLLGAQKCPNR